MAANETPAPTATYRLQLHPGFGFDAAAAVADYLAALGVSHLYASPYLQAAPGSTHGYDVLDHTRVNEELGGSAGHKRLCDSLGRAKLGQVLDIVPNHMSIASRGNVWWWDVLENGPSSRYADYFDVDWRPLEESMHNTVLMPVLGDHYGRALEAGDIQLRRDGGTFTVHYADHVAPVAPRSLDGLLSTAAEHAESDTLAFLADAFGRLPRSTATDRASLTRRHRDKEVLRKQLEALCREQPTIAAAIDEVVKDINASPDELDVLLERQSYRLAFWRTAEQELDYRRFFDIDTLVSLRMEDEKVFADTHRLILEWLRAGVLDGVRVDHPDGLLDPQQYFERLREAAPRAWVVAEKILEPGERLPASWPVAGTTGYDFLNRLGGLFVAAGNEQALTNFYHEFTDQTVDYIGTVREKKHQVLRELFASDVNRLTSLMRLVCQRHRRYRDYTRRDISSMLREAIACFPVYRTYVQPAVGHVSEDDVRYVNEAIDAAKTYRADIDADLFDFLRDVLLLRVRGDLESELVARFQQQSGPVMAKGVEDTVFYNFNRLVALNEVGGDPGRFGLSLAAFHQSCLDAQAHWPQAMLASTTHDTKRSEDVRARMALISEIPDRWMAAVGRWSALAERYRTYNLPDRNTEYFLYQTLFGAWPIGVNRAVAYALKAIREAKLFTSWTNPQAGYEEAVTGFVTALLNDSDFKTDLQQFLNPLIEPGRVNSLAQTLVKLTAPGVPDVYQGTELWALTLVDPDNRRPVDFELRRMLLAALDGATPESILARSDEGLPKLWVMRQTLRFRRQRSDLFGPQAAYRPLTAVGLNSEHVVAFQRGDGAITVVPRLMLGMPDGWQDTKLDLPPGNWSNLMTGDAVPGGGVPLADLLRRFPVALLVNGPTVA